MIKLTDAKLTDGLPRIVASQTWVQVISAVYDVLRKRTRGFYETAAFPDVENCTEEMLDLLAVFLKIEWYDSHADLETKRRLVSTAVSIRRYAGTAKAVIDQASVIYPNSEVQEWFEYDGTPGLWRLNVNITNTPTTFYTISEMENLLGYTKRCSAHLERIGYMIRRSIEIGSRVEAWAVSPPLCGTIRCGTWWMPSTLGWSENRTVQAAGRAEGFEVWPELTGTLPEISTVGYSACGAVHCGGQVTGHEISPPPADTVKCGTEWMPATLGWSAAGTMQAAAEAEANLGCPDLAGTLPTVSKIGYSVTAPAEASADAQLHTTELPESGTSPCGMKP